MNRTQELFCVLLIGLLIFVLGFSLGISTGIPAGKDQAKKEFRQEAIDKGLARYNPTNARFEWKTNVNE